MEEEHTEDRGPAGCFLEEEGVARHVRPQRLDDRKLQRHKAAHAIPGPHGDPPQSSESPFPSSNRKPSPAVSLETTLPSEPLISQVPLRLQIKVSGQRSSLGISIAGGKGSLPYKEQDEGIFISRVSAGGAAEKAGVHVGDRVLEVNGLDMQEVSHHQAVSALRNAGSCIKMMVLRQRNFLRDAVATTTTRVTAEMEVPGDQQHEGGHGSILSQPPPQPLAGESSSVGRKLLTNRIEAVVCNGNGLADPERSLNGRLFGRSPEVSFTDTLQQVKNTMTIPRIILTHPSTSDEDIEPLTQESAGRGLDDADDPDRQIYSECYNHAFSPA
ncbi:patj homolog [Hypomesus transpacificus]|uniref:patj homolog n=1 Tax=Hypomesus transpacificus TaxID=137520 RepID=UPI001F07D871|nr:patj homolog [Hypomesus transpacificus]